MKCDELEEYYYYEDRVITPATHMYRVYHADEVDAAIAELKDKCQMHDFFWEGCGFAKRGFKNSIAVSEAFDKLEAKNAEFKQKLEDVQATAYADMVDAGMRERRLRSALWRARAERAYAEAKVNHQKARRYEEHKEHTIAKCFDAEVHKWKNVGRKCLAKAEEYK